MKTLHHWRTVVALLCAAAVVLTVSIAVCAAEFPVGYKEGEVVLVGEKTDVAENEVAVRNGTVITPDALDWEDGGIHGKAIHLNGVGDYIEYKNPSLCAGEITVAGWLNWYGSVTNDPDKALNQQFFTVFRDAQNYFTLNLHARRDNIRESEDGTVYRVDGVTITYKIEGSTGKLVEAFNQTSGGVDYAIRQNEWTHLAITLSKHAIKLYINGVHWFEEPLDNANGILAANGVRIGGTVEDGVYTLSGLVDDVAVFKGILSGDEIAYLASGAGLDFSAPVNVPTPTGVAGDTTKQKTGGDTFRDTDQSDGFLADITIPTFTWYVLGGLLVLMVVLTIALNKHEAKRKKEGDR